MSVCDSLQTVLVSASSSEASVSQGGRALVPVSGVSVPVLSVSVDEGVYVPAAPSAPVCTSVSVQVPRLQDSSVLVQASGIASSKSSSSSSSVTVPVCTVPQFCVSVVPASGDKSVSSSRSFCDTDYVFLHERVHTSGFPNYVSCRLPVPSRLNIPLWRQYLHDYHDARICDFLEYGWPVGYDYSTQGFPVSQLRNHHGALLFPDAIDSYLQNEICRNAVLGPFETNPFSCPVALSPLNSVPKHDSAERRIIVDLSWPAGTSFNGGISSSSYLGEDISLTYPTVDSIASLICSVGTACLLYKRDLKRAYRQFPVDPLDYPLLGYCCDNATVVSALTSGKVKDQSIAAISREIWYLAASHDFEMRAVHLPGEENRAADLLSRWHIDSSFEARFKLLPVFSRLSPVPVPPDVFTVYDY